MIRHRHLLSTLVFLCLAALFFVPACQSSCASNDDCDGDDICIFPSGKCGAKCDPQKADSCPSNFTCDSCATSSAPGAKDCVAACVEVSSGAGGPGGW